MYGLIEGGVIRISDHAFIPLDERNCDYRSFLAWVAEGNAPVPAQPAPWYDLVGEQWVGNLERARTAKIAELRQAAYLVSQAGIATSPGLRMKYGEQDCVLVDGVVRYAELKGLSIVPKLIEADGTIHTNVTLADGQTIRLEQFEAAYAADERLRALAAQVQAATSVAEVEAVVWSQP